MCVPQDRGLQSCYLGSRCAVSTVFPPQLQRWCPSESWFLEGSEEFSMGSFVGDSLSKHLLSQGSNTECCIFWSFLGPCTHLNSHAFFPLCWSQLISNPLAKGLLASLRVMCSAWGVHAAVACLKCCQAETLASWQGLQLAIIVWMYRSPRHLEEEQMQADSPFQLLSRAPLHLIQNV